MEIFYELSPNNIKGVSLALGFFDGVHKGHQAVINTAIEQGYKTCVITFKKHPLETFGKQVTYINSPSVRIELFEKLGVDYVFELDFTEELSRMTGEEYIKLLVETFEHKIITTGFNHYFGGKYNGVQSGSPELLQNCQSKYNYKYIQVPPQKLDEEVISSTIIKKYLSEGDIGKANKMLGYNFSIKGTVIEGNKLGREIGFPTVNIRYPQNIVEIPYGVYCSKIDKYKSVTNYGVKPTVDKISEPIIESHILNFDKNIYNTDIEVEFLEKIRDERKFNSLEELKQQINKDIQQCLEL